MNRSSLRELALHDEEARPPGLRLQRALRSLLLANVVLITLMADPILAGASPGPDSATQAIVAFDAANKLYEQGKFAEAASGYQQLIDAGQRSVTLFFNLGNAWFKAGQTGRAIAAYRQAERLAPRDPNVQFNLTFARKRVTSGDAPTPALLDRLIGGLTLDEWTRLTSAAFCLALVLLAAGELRESFRSTARRYALATGVATLLFALGATGAARRWFHPDDGIIVVSNAIARAGPLEDAKVLHQFRDGTEVKVLDRKRLGTGDTGQTWFQARNLAGEVGWIRDDQLTLIQ